MIFQQLQKQQKIHETVGVMCWQLCAKLDTNGDGTLSREEFAAAMPQWDDWSLPWNGGNCETFHVKIFKRLCIFLYILNSFDWFLQDALHVVITTFVSFGRSLWGPLPQAILRPDHVHRGGTFQAGIPETTEVGYNLDIWVIWVYLGMPLCLEGPEQKLGQSPRSWMCPHHLALHVTPLLGWLLCSVAEMIL